ncbi:unnamed protein product [Angiostrongylus costaricensis]|uniref:Uncharacterized protein n=1 Tax=Angiostrongylus costaricensis TaxID=334426 RepID=A0A0R3PM82_ANGCS|nr:unnamed protein product [Angiostrongylus costaricensis]
MLARSAKDQVKGDDGGAGDEESGRGRMRAPSGTRMRDLGKAVRAVAERRESVAGAERGDATGAASSYRSQRAIGEQARRMENYDRVYAKHHKVLRKSANGNEKRRIHRQKLV